MADGIRPATPAETAELRRMAAQLEQDWKGRTGNALAHCVAFQVALVNEATKYAGNEAAAKKLIESLVSNEIWARSAQLGIHILNWKRALIGLHNGTLELAGWKQSDASGELHLGIAPAGAIKAPELRGWPLLALLVIGAGFTGWVLKDAQKISELEKQADLVVALLKSEIVAKIPLMTDDQATAVRKALEVADQRAKQASPMQWLAQLPANVAAGVNDAKNMVVDTVNQIAAGPVGIIALLALLGTAFFRSRRSNSGSRWGAALL